ncbi:SPOR domain-containing protein [Micrococcoides hystricis]|uniref:SPOR domain-containing protein n=1 Tax=Micrococcoides hystricis TaxID=1572761 RepID=A0ABV6P7N8_9MICC
MAENQYWYNVVTGEIEKGQQSDWTKLLGPYATEDEAKQALAKVAENNERWDELDEDDRQRDNNPLNDDA